MKIIDDLQTALYQARELWLHNSVSAYACYEELLLRYPDHPAILREYGKAVFMEHDDLEKALYLLERALTDQPEALLSWLYLGVLYSYGYGKGYPESVNVYRRIIEYFPDQVQACVEAYLRIGMSYQSPGVQMSLQDAIEAFRQAIKLDSSCPEAYQCLAQGLYDLGDWLGAHGALVYAIQLREQRGMPFSHLLKPLEDLDQQKPWKKTIYAVPSIAFNWPHETME